MVPPQSRVNQVLSTPMTDTLAPQGVPPYRVLCMQLDAATSADGHTHVLHVETRDPDGGQTRWRPVDVIAAVRDGERFLVAEDDRGTETLLEPAVCPRCPAVTLAVGPSQRPPTPCA